MRIGHHAMAQVGTMEPPAACEPQPSKPFRFFALPLEIRELVYNQLLCPAAHRWKDAESHVHYAWDLSLLRANRRMHSEALDVFYRLNQFVAIETPFPQAQQHIQIEGYIPVLLSGDAAKRFTRYSMLIRIDAPLFNVFSEEARRFVIHADDVHAFAVMWNYQDLSTPGLNQHLRLVMQVADGKPLPGDEGMQRQPLHWTVQKKIIEPLGEVKDLREVEVQGLHSPVFEQRMRKTMLEPNRPAEECLDEAVKLKDLGNKAIGAGDIDGAIKLYQDSFRAMHIVCDGRRRSIWGDRYFQREMLYGAHKGQNGGMVRLILRIKLVANTVLAFGRKDTAEGYEWAHFWGMRTIDLMRDAVDDDHEEPMLEFPAASEVGKIYYRTGVASRHLGKIEEARSLLKTAMAYLPHDPQVKQAFAAVAPKTEGD